MVVKPLADAARKSLHARWATSELAEGVSPMTPLRRLFRVRYEFSDPWMQFRNALKNGNANLSLTIDRDSIPIPVPRREDHHRGVPAVCDADRRDYAAVLHSDRYAAAGPGKRYDVDPEPYGQDGAHFRRCSSHLRRVELSSSTDWIISADAGIPIASVRRPGGDGDLYSHNEIVDLQVRWGMSCVNFET